MKAISFACGLLLAFCGMATAQTLQSTSKHWRTYTYTDAGSTQCYIVSNPIKQKGNDKGRAQPFMLATRTAKHIDEVSVSSGYPYREKSDVMVTIDKTAYHLIAKADRAWAKDAATDKAMIAKMKKARNITVKGVSKKGFNTQDFYFLSGFNAAYQKMGKLCH